MGWASELKSYDGPVEREFIRSMTMRVRHSVLSNVLGVLLIGALCFFVPFGQWLAIGLAARILAVGNTALNARALEKALKSGKPIDPLINRFAVGLFLAGLTWSLLINVIPPAHISTFPALLIFAVVLTGVSLISATAAPVPRIMWAFMTGFFIAGIPWISRMAGHYGVLPLIAILGLAFAIVYFSLGLMKEARRSAELLVENRGLATRLTKANEELAEAMEQANFLADHDQLTRLHNRRAFENRTEAIHAEGREKDYSLLLIDLDHFKNVNDQCGHGAGDVVLRRCGEILSAMIAALPRGAFAARIGGEEFALLVPLIHDSSLDELAQKLCETMRTIPAPQNYQGIISASIGHARWAHGEPFDTLFARTDRALYAAKFKGRNRAEAA